jgi:polyphenol oxidase
MIKKTKGNISFYQSEKLANHSEIIHFFSTRNMGVSKGVFESLNFGTHNGEGKNMKRNLGLLAKEFHLDTSKFVIPKQTHGDRICLVNESNYNQVFENTDALITNIPSLILAVKTADCVPILLFDPIIKAIGAVHSGWKGTAQNIVGKSITAMIQNFGSNPADIIVAIGPCIGSENYEVGDEVIQKIKLVLSDHKMIFNSENDISGKAHLDLTRANFQLIIQTGITENNIEISHLCTYSKKDEFFSARRDGNITGRMINGISIKSFNGIKNSLYQTPD